MTPVAGRAAGAAHWSHANANLQHPVDTMPTHDRRAAAIAVGLSKSYGDVHAVRGVDLTIAPGEIVAVLGPNGAGKSTTTELILGLIRPDAGRCGCSAWSPAAVREGRVGAMLQAGALLHEATVGDVLRLMHGLHAHPLPLAR